jgi:hypothetical protein
MRWIMAASVGAMLCAAPAWAKDATCFTTDDGRYPCQFTFLDDAGSFEIAADGKPTFQLWIDSPGVAFGSAVYEPGGRSVALPGTYQVSRKDPACWRNSDTDTQICAW